MGTALHPSARASPGAPVSSPAHRPAARRRGRHQTGEGTDGAARAGEDAGAPWDPRGGAGRRGRRRSMRPTGRRRPARTPALHGTHGAARAGEDAGAPCGRRGGVGRRGRRRSMGPALHGAGAPNVRARQSWSAGVLAGHRRRRAWSVGFPAHGPPVRGRAVVRRPPHQPFRRLGGPALQRIVQRASSSGAGPSAERCRYPCRARTSAPSPVTRTSSRRQPAGASGSGRKASRYRDRISSRISA